MNYQIIIDIYDWGENTMDYTMIREYIKSVSKYKHSNEIIKNHTYKLADMISEMFSKEGCEEVPFDIINSIIYGEYYGQFCVSYINFDNRVWMIMPQRYNDNQLIFLVERKEDDMYDKYMHRMANTAVSTVIGKYRIIYKFDFFTTVHINIVDDDTHEFLGDYYAHEMQSDNFYKTDEYKELSKLFTNTEFEEIKSWIFLNDIKNNFMNQQIHLR